MKRLLSILCVLGLLGTALPVSAATSAYPTGPKSVTVGQTFSVTFNLGSAQDVDTIRLNGSFTQDLLEYKGASPTGVFQNVSPGTYADQAKGIFSFGSFTLSSHANGAVRVAILTFRAKKAGAAYVQLTTGSRVLSNGEDQLGSVGRLNIEVKESPTPQPAQPGETVPVGEPTITLTSPTHPKSEIWYPTADVKVEWKIEGKSVSRTYIGFDQEPDGAAETPISTTSAHFSAKNDGVWYVHLYVRYADGSTGRAELPIQIDRTNPGVVVPLTDQTDVVPEIPNTLRYTALDGTSGVAIYEIYLNGTMVTSTALTSYSLAGLQPGSYDVMVKAYDRAGNSSSGTTTFRLLERMGEAAKPVAAGWPLKTIVAVGAFLILIIFLLAFLPSRRRKDEEEKTPRGKKKSTKE